MSEIRVPTLGESIVEATVASWLKQEGEPVRKGEALVELETDKVNVEVSAEQEGVLQQIVKQVGNVVAVGDVLGTIGEGTGVAAKTSANGAAAPTVPAQQPQVATQEQQAVPAQQPTSEHRAPSPLARRIAAENNVDLAAIRGTSPHGRITKEDVIGYLQQQQEQNQPTQPISPVSSARPAQPPPRGITAPVTPEAASEGREERIRLSRRRQTIAQRLVEAQHTAAMLTTFNEIDMSAVMEIRGRHKEAFKERHQISLGLMSFFTKAVVGALKAFPRLNAEIQGNEMVIKHYYDIGIAVAAEEGLVVPVLRDADRKSFAEIEREIAGLAKRARENALSLPELQGGTFTITNGGVFGSLLSTPILNAPQVGILGMHKIEQRPVALNGQVVIRPMMYVALSYDHRIVDGSEAVQFLVRIKEMVEDPETLLLEG